jgi:hypothetical protein
MIASLFPLVSLNTTPPLSPLLFLEPCNLRRVSSRIIVRASIPPDPSLPHSLALFDPFIQTPTDPPSDHLTPAFQTNSTYLNPQPIIQPRVPHPLLLHFPSYLVPNPSPHLPSPPSPSPTSIPPPQEIQPNKHPRQSKQNRTLTSQLLLLIRYTSSGGPITQGYWYL